MIETREPRIILFDLETLPNLKEVMRVFPSLSDYPGRTLKAQLNSIICAGWKVYGESKVHCINAWDFPEWKKSVNADKAVAEAIREVLVSADAVVTHNGKRFDWKFLQTRLMIHGIKPLPKIPHIDTCAEAKRHLLMHNNRLKNLAEYFTTERKQDNDGWPLWERVLERQKSAMREMAEYCKQDVLALEALFKKLRPLISNIPNYNLRSIGEKLLCPRCGSTRLQRRGSRDTNTSSYNRYMCRDCWGWSRTDAADKNPRAI